MAEEGTPQDAAYSDEEFGSEHEYEASDGEFPDEDTVVDTTSDGVKPVGGDEEDADYAGEFDEDDTPIVAFNSPSLTIGERTTEPTLTNANMAAKCSHEEAEPYDGEFEKDDPEVADAVPPSFESNEITVQRAPDMLPLGGKESPESPNDQIDENDGNDTEYSNDLEDDMPAAAPEITILPRNPCEENATQRTSSAPTQVPDDILPKTRIVRADSMPIVLSATLLEKWMDSIPPELSPKRHDRSRRPSACFPVEEDLQQPNLADDEHDAGEADNGVTVNSVSTSIISRVRARSYQNLLQEKIAVPIRRTQSLVYIKSLPSVEEIDAAEEMEPEHNQDGDEFYSDDEGSYGEDNHASFESEHDNDEVKPAKDERLYALNAAAHSSALEGYPATTSAGALDSNSPMVEPSTIETTPGVQISPNEGNRSDPKSLQNGEDDYADEMEDDFSSGSNTPQFEGEDTPHKSGDETGDYDVDEFIEDRNCETETLLQETRALLELQQNEIKTNEQTSSQQNVMPPGITTQSGDTAVEMGQTASSLQNNKESEAEKYASPYDDDDEFADADAEFSNQETAQRIATEDHDGLGQYDSDADEFENHTVTVEEPREVADLEKSEDFAVPQTVDVSEDAKPNGEATNANEAIAVSPFNAVVEFKANASPAQPPETSQSNDLSSVTIAVEQDRKKAAVISKGSTKPSRSTPQPVRPKPPVKNMDSTPKQSSQPTKSSRPPTKRATPAPPSAPSPSSIDVKPATAPRPSRNKFKTGTPDCQTTASNPTGNSGETTTPKPSPTRQASSPKTKQKVSSPRLPSNACSDPYQHLLNESPQLPRKEPVPKQKMSSKPSSRGEQGGKRRQLQPVRTPANLRFNLPKMDKTKRDWLFVNMFRHGDDLSKYEAFVPSTLLARPPTTNHSKETKKRPLSAHHVYGTPQTTRFVSPSRKLVPQPNSAIQDRERNWVATTPHDSKLPSYDSILDKYCTAVTNPMVQRQIYQTRHRDLSPQLAFVLEKRVEKSCRKGFYDSFGGVSSYKTEIVPTSPGDGMRQRQISSHSQTKSGMLERHATSFIAAQEPPGLLWDL